MLDKLAFANSLAVLSAVLYVFFAIVALISSRAFSGSVPGLVEKQGRPSGSSACSLFDDLVRAHEHGLRDRESQRLGGL
jgi:hypothetical protein